jgi:hypothetical protein
MSYSPLYMGKSAAMASGRRGKCANFGRGKDRVSVVVKRKNRAGGRRRRS